MNILLIAGLVLLALLLLRAFTSANPAWLAQNLPRLGGGVLLAIAAFLLVRGSTSAALPLAVVGLWLLSGQARAPWGGTAGSGGGQRTSTVKTDTLEMQLDLDSGDMRGRVLKGFFAGRRIEDLRPVELAHLWQDCRFTDPQSAQLVEAYLDRVHPSWREDLARAEAEAPRGPDGKMTAEEALDILGLAPGATAEDVRRAHRALMLKLHPDRGGSTYLAAKINEAKDVLLADGRDGQG